MNIYSLYKGGLNMARTKEQNERIRQNTKAKIHSVAIDCFAQNGLGNTTMQDLANQADISVGLLYRHYKTKDELFDGLVNEAICGHEKMIDRIESLPPLEAIGVLVDDILSELSKGYEFSQFMGILLQNPNDKQKQANSKLILAIAKIIENGQCEKMFTIGNPIQLAQFLVSTFQGLSSTQLLLKDQFMLPTSEQIMSFLEVKNHG